jgi:hypothetical protein
MLDRTNLIAIVSGGNYPIIAPNSGKREIIEKQLFQNN